MIGHIIPGSPTVGCGSGKEPNDGSIQERTKMVLRPFRYDLADRQANKGRDFYGSDKSGSAGGRAGGLT
jgi:hypothetical protein